MSLRARGLRQLGKTLGFFAATLFLPAWSLRFWQAWLFLFLTVGFWIFLFVDLLKHDPQLVERR
jgi:hypothetical protein